MSMSNASIPAFEIGLNALSAILDKAETYAAAKSIDPTVLLSARLFPDMFAFTRQVQSACDQAKNGGARLAGIDPPRYEDNEKTIAELKARIAKTIAFVKTLDAKNRRVRRPRDHFPARPEQQGPHERCRLSQPLRAAKLLLSPHHCLRHSPSLRCRNRQARLPRCHPDEDDVRHGD